MNFGAFFELLLQITRHTHLFDAGSEGSLSESYYAPILDKSTQRHSHPPGILSAQEDMVRIVKLVSKLSAWSLVVNGLLAERVLFWSRKTQYYRQSAHAKLAVIRIGCKGLGRMILSSPQWKSQVVNDVSNCVSCSLPKPHNKLGRINSLQQQTIPILPRFLITS